MEWTKEKPTEPGWYWLIEELKKDKNPTMARMAVHHYDGNKTQLIFKRISDIGVQSLEELRGKNDWLGPIEVPEPPKE